MRLALVVRRFSDRGGIESNVLALARHLVAKKHHVQIVCQRVEGEAARVDAEIVHVGAPGVLGETARLFWFARNAAREVARLDPDVSYTASHAHGVSVARLEGGLVADHREAVGGGLPELAAARIERAKIEGAKCVLALSDRDARRTGEMYGVAARVVRNGIDAARFHAARFDVTTRAQNTTQTVGFIGNGFHRKNLGALINALARKNVEGGGLRDAGGGGQSPSPKLLVAGSDRRADEYEARAKAHAIDATFLGRIADVRALLAKIDVLAMPSLYEPFGLVALEAWASGVPVVLSAIAGASEIAPHPELVVTDPRDPRAIAVALERSKHVDRARCREVAEAHPLEASLDAIEAALEEARRAR